MRYFNVSVTIQACFTRTQFDCLHTTTELSNFPFAHLFSHLLSPLPQVPVTETETSVADGDAAEGDAAIDKPSSAADSTTDIITTTAKFNFVDLAVRSCKISQLLSCGI